MLIFLNPQNLSSNLSRRTRQHWSRFTVPKMKTVTCLPGSSVLVSSCLQAVLMATKPREVGYTTRARGYYQWIGEARKKTTGIGTLSHPVAKIARVGNHIWLPYSHMNDALNKRDFIPAEEFTVDLIVKLVELVPRDWSSNPIRQYQAESVPSFVSHLQELYPDMLAQAAEKSEHLRKILASMTKVGPNVGSFDGWVWDGTHMITAEKKNMSAFFPFSPKEIRILPADAAVVTISDDAQVNSNTVFAD